MEQDTNTKKYTIKRIGGYLHKVTPIVDGTGKIIHSERGKGSSLDLFTLQVPGEFRQVPRIPGRVPGTAHLIIEPGSRKGSN